MLHCVFSTTQRCNIINSELAEGLYPYFGGIARKNKMKILVAGGMPNHVHLLISLPATINVSRALQLLKGSSSRWIHDTFPDQRLFQWQRGYGAFSIGVSDLDRTVRYIENQPRHHRQMTFEDEYLAFVRKNGLEYDEKYIFD